jgi:hypothetical protein
VIEHLPSKYEAVSSNSSIKKKKKKKARHWWLTPVMLANYEVEIRRIMVQVQPEQRVHKISSPK